MNSPPWCKEEYVLSVKAIVPSQQILLNVYNNVIWGSVQ